MEGRRSSDRRERERPVSPPPHVKARLAAESRKPVKLTGESQFAPQPHRLVEASVLPSPLRAPVLILGFPVLSDEPVLSLNEELLLDLDPSMDRHGRME